MVHEHRDVQGGAQRAAVFGVSDGLVSNVGLILGVAGAGQEGNNVIVAGVAGLLAGAFSMAAGEYVSVKAEAELVERELAIERASLANMPEKETEELASIYRSRGVPADEAAAISEAVMADPEVALEVHAREELGVDPDAIGDPVAAAASSFVAFAVGAIVPLLPWLVGSGTAAVVASLVLALLAAAAIGAVLAHYTERSKIATAARQVAIAALAAGVTYAIGSALGVAIE
jgi:VIT1/CCC1 family predicted Fe2+/Mn2+ transporter